MNMSEEERQARLKEVIEMGEELFELALARHERALGMDEARASDAAEQEQEQAAPAQDEEAQGTLYAEARAANADVGELRAAAETFFRVLRKLVQKVGRTRAGWAHSSALLDISVIMVIGNQGVFHHYQLCNYGNW